MGDLPCSTIERAVVLADLAVDEDEQRDPARIDLRLRRRVRATRGAARKADAQSR